MNTKFEERGGRNEGRCYDLEKDVGVRCGAEGG